MTTLGLCMIVKNEASVVTRCLDSMRGLLDYVIVEDTGSTDDTIQIIRQWLDDNDVPGQVFCEPFRDFAYNRTRVLEEMRKETDIDYVLVVDADDEVRYRGDPIEIKKGLKADCYDVDIFDGGLVYFRPVICSNRKLFRYRSVLHEFMWLDEPFTTECLDSLVILMNRDGVRARDKDTHRKDIGILEDAIAGLDPKDEELRSRYLFYLGQAYKVAGDKDKAIAAYARQLALGGPAEEMYVGLLMLARLKEEIGAPIGDILETYKRAAQVVPHRAEAFHGAAKVCKSAGLNAEGMYIARRGIALPVPRGLFVESWIYQWGILEEYAVCARNAECLVEAWLAWELTIARKSTSRKS